MTMIQPLFFVVRHGRTPDNKENAYRGWSNEPEASLSPEGRDDARKAALYLKSTGYDFPAILSDSLSRAEETKQIVADILGIKIQKTDDRVRTIDVGDFTGKSKKDHPLTDYMANPSKVIPGGESFNSFNKRQSLFFADVMEVVAKLKKPIIIIAHGANVAFLYNHFNNTAGQKMEYEGLVNPGGVLVFVKEGIIPLTNKRENCNGTDGGIKLPFKDGTPASGFVTDEESVPPRECWNCKWSVKDLTETYGCTHIVVRLDPKLVSRRQNDGTIAVGDRDCCDMFANRIAT
jgi:broad specificity phosphatase PhoE